MSKCLIYLLAPNDQKKEKRNDGSVLRLRPVGPKFIGPTDSSLKKCLRFFFLFELGFLYTTYFQKCLQFTRKATTTVLYNTLLQNTKYCVVFYFSFFTTECTIFTTLLKVHFFYLEKSHCTTLYALHYEYSMIT